MNLHCVRRPLVSTPSLGAQSLASISGARVGEAAWGTVVLHAAPAAAVGRRIALVRTDDVIELDADAGRLHLDVSTDELERRRAALMPPGVPATEQRGWVCIYRDHVLHADSGCDLDVLSGSSGATVPRRAC